MRYHLRQQEERSDFIPALRSDRQGSTLLIVIALLAMLSLLGVVFFSFATQEQENAKNYEEAAKHVQDPELDPDVYFDWALRQLILGPEDYEKNSALWGRHLSLLPNAYGFDAHPHTGNGIEIRQQATRDMSGNLTALGDPIAQLQGSTFPLDVNQDGTKDGRDLVDAYLNRSPAAQVIAGSMGNPNVAYEMRRDIFPEPDVDYTYPDINNPFLAYHGWTLADETTTGIDYNRDGDTSDRFLVRVVKPSFFRPEILQRQETGNADEDANGDGVWDPATEDANGNGRYDAGDLNHDGTQDNIARLDPTWYWANWSRSRSLRPHPAHYFVSSDAQQAPTLKRFLDDSNPTDAAIIGALPGGSKGFPFNGRRDPQNQSTTFPLRMGVWGGYHQDVTAEFDADADGDNIYEAILVDLGFPPQERPSDGALYVPIFALTVYDADALLNLNAVGNLSGDTNPPGPGGYFGNAAGLTLSNSPYSSISRSHQGLSPYEINPMWALTRDPNTGTPITSDFATYFGRSFLATPSDRWEFANMEMWWLNKGRVEFGGTQPRIHSGRMGDAARVWNILQLAPSTPVINSNTGTGVNLFPFPGVWDRDDNRNANEGGAGNTALGQSLKFKHPLSLTGRGRFTSPGAPKTLITAAPFGAANLNRWIGYSDYDVAGYDPTTTTSSLPDWATLLSGNLMQRTRNGRLYVDPINPAVPNAADDVLSDDMPEMTLETRSIQRPSDEVFPTADNAVLQLAKTDIDNTGSTSRLTYLMPGNIDPSDTSIEANDRRRRFTVDSWDRKQFSFPRLYGPGPDGAPGKAGFDDNQNSIVDDLGELGWPGTDDLRAWEFNSDADNDRLPEFPPRFASIPAYAGMRTGVPHPSDPNFSPLGRLSPLPQDPFRTELRRLLEVEFGNRNELKLQFRLGINQLLDVARTGVGPGHPFTSPLNYRPLTPHATNTAVVQIPIISPSGVLPPWPPQAWSDGTTNYTQDEVQEFWAQYDRQRMARDIYVMLYTLCGGLDNVNATSSPGSTAYPDQKMLDQMAQFAVNMIDELDRDNVMTIFEYDTNLADGWDLDDQPGTDSNTGPDKAADRKTVIGVEAQELTFSETLWAFQPKLLNNNQYTPFDESVPPTSLGGTQGYHFAQIELRNASPAPVDLASQVSTGTGSNSTWRLRWVDDPNPDNTPQVSTTHTIATGNGIFFKKNSSGTIDSVAPGALFTIGTTNWTAPDASDLFADYTSATANHERIAPRGGTGSASATTNPTNLTPNTNLDLVNTMNPGMAPNTNQSRFALARGSRGDFISPDYEPTGSSATLVLERRVNPNLPQLPATVNPWVIVDYTYINKTNLISPDPGSAPTQAQTTTALANLQSRQRPEPLNAAHNGQEALFDTTVDAIQANSINQDNRLLTPITQFDLVQPHFDRDFASAIELISLPLYGPKHVTSSILGHGHNPNTQNDPASDANGPYSAAARIMQPIHPTNVNFHNHWHRLFGFVEVPSRMHLQLGGPFATTRVPGRLNLNTIRHPEVLAALLDDPDILTAPTTIPGDTSGRSYSFPGIDNRQWWHELLVSRDGVQPGTGLALPGMATSRPFRDMGHTRNLTGVAAPGANNPPQRLSPVEDSVLRHHPSEYGSGTFRGLFEIGNSGEIQGNSGGANGTPIPEFVRRRILSKIAGNTTTRSNVFYVFISVQFHEAYEDPTTGAIRVGGRIDLNSDTRRDDGHRGFFVIDRSLAEEAYNTRTATFDWRELVKHRLTIN